jgi:hypothetical protein
LVTLGNIDCIKGLIKNRWVIDTNYKDKMEIHYNNAGNCQALSQEIICMYADLDVLIEKAELNVKQKFIVEKLMEGYTERDIADIFNRDKSNIHKSFQGICLKLKKINDLNVKYDYIFVNCLKAPWNYKKCSYCDEYKPVTEDFFTYKKGTSDGFHTVCKFCK